MKLFGNENFSGEKDSGKVLIIVFNYYYYSRFPIFFAPLKTPFSSPKQKAHRINLNFICFYRWHFTKGNCSHCFYLSLLFFHHSKVKRIRYTGLSGTRRKTSSSGNPKQSTILHMLLLLDSTWQTSLSVEVKVNELYVFS